MREVRSRRGDEGVERMERAAMKGLGEVNVHELYKYNPVKPIIHGVT